MERTLPGKAAWLLVAAWLGAVAGCKPALPEAPKKHQKTNVETWTVRTSDIHKEVDLPGRLNAEKTVRLSAEIAGIVKSVPADVGTNVEKGEILLVFDTADLEQRKAQADAQVRSLKARLEDLERGAREQQVREAEAGLEAAKAQLDLAQTIAKRRQALLEEDLVPQEAVDQALTGLQQARAQYKRATEAVDLLREGATEEARRALEAQRDAAAASLALAESAVKKAKVKAPFRGVVIRRFLDEDEFAGPGSPLFDVIPETPLTLSLGVPERIFVHLRKGEEAKIRFEVLDLEIERKISMLAPAANPRTQTFAVEIDIDNPVVVKTSNPGEEKRIPLRPGLIANVTFNLGTKEGAVVIPADALVLDGEILLVYVVEEGVVRIRPVEIGIKKAGVLEITSGLEPGEALVVEGQKMVSEGDEVKVVKKHIGPLEDVVE